LAQAYTNALHLSQQTKGSLGLPTFEPEAAHIPLKKIDGKISPAAALQSTPRVWPRNHHHTLQKAIISLVLMAMFIIPLSLGFLVGRERGQVSPAFSEQYAAALHKAGAHVSTPGSTPLVSTSRSTPMAHPSGGKTIPQH